MTVEQVFGFLKRKIELNYMSAEFLKPTMTHLEELKNLNYSFKCEDDKLIAYKNNEGYNYTFEVGGLKDYIETYFDEETGDFKGYLDSENNFINMRR